MVTHATSSGPSGRNTVAKRAWFNTKELHGALGDIPAVVLAAPSYTHLVYRPGVPLVHAVVERGAVT